MKKTYCEKLKDPKQKYIPVMYE